MWLDSPNTRRRQAYLLLADLAIVVISYTLALVLRFLGPPPAVYVDSLRDAVPFLLLAYPLANYALGLYHRVWRYARPQEMVYVLIAAGLGSLGFLAYDVLAGPTPNLPLSTVAFGGLFCCGGFVAARYRSRLVTGSLYRSRRLFGLGGADERQRVLVVGAGQAGQVFAWRCLNQKAGEGYHIVGFVDDDPEKQGMLVHGRKVLGTRRDILALVERQRVELIVLAIFNIDGEAFRAILDICELSPAAIKVLPNIFDLLQSTTGVPRIRGVSSGDLLGRRTAKIDREACAGILAGKTVLVTGAAGSIGSELCRQVLTFNPARLVMLDNNESDLHDLFIGLRPPGSAEEEEPRLVPVVGDITNETKVRSVCERHRPQVVFHAAAYKHVPLMEEHPDEAVRVNVLGTRVVADAAVRYCAERFVLVSTDKAINPSCVMGASKRLAEMLTVQGDGAVAGEGARGTLLTAVRFGNVLGSRGSVLPTFERQIEQGGPVTVTHVEMTRYFMSISEAVSLIIQAAALTEGGDIFMLDMGQRIVIDQLARRLIRLRGLRPEVDIKIVYTGVRPGEKMHEELLGEGERRGPTSHPKIYRLRSDQRFARAELEEQLETLSALVATEQNGAVTARLMEMVSIWPAEPALPAA